MVFFFGDRGCRLRARGGRGVRLETARVIYFEKQNCDDCAMRETSERERGREPAPAHTLSSRVIRRNAKKIKRENVGGGGGGGQPYIAKLLLKFSILN